MKEKLLTISDHVHIEGQLVLFQVINGKLYVAGKQVYDNLLITIKSKYFDEEGEISDLSNTSVKDFVVSLFGSVKVMKIYRGRVVNNWK